MKTSDIKGIIPPVITPMNNDPEQTVNHQALREQVERWFGQGRSCDGSILTNARQFGALTRAEEALSRAECALRGGMTPDAVLTDAEEAMSAIGELPESVATSGVKPKRIQLLAILWSGLLCSVAGTYLSTVSVTGFTEDMVQGRGFTAFSALIFGNGNPFVTWAVSILFGFADALGIRVELNSAGMSSSIIKMFPYLLSVAALAVSCYAREASRRKKKA